MARLNFRVKEVNDLSNDGLRNKRVVLVADTKNYDQSGPTPVGDEMFPKDVALSARLELVVPDAVQVAHFAIGSLHGIDLHAGEWDVVPVPAVQGSLPAGYPGSASYADPQAGTAGQTQPIR